MNSGLWPWRSPGTAVVLAALAGILVTAGAFFAVRFWEYRVAVIDLQSKAKSYLEFIDADLGDASSLMYDIAAFMSSDRHEVSAQEFAQFSAASHRRVSALRNIGWAPHVTSAEREAFERNERASGLKAYQIVEIGAHGTLMRAAPRPEYYPLIYIQTFGKRQRLFGVDLIAEKTRASAVRRAIQTGRPAATPPTDVKTIHHMGAGLLSYMPVYRWGEASRTPGRHARGVVLGIFDINEIVGAILAKHHSLDGLNLYLFNPRASGDHRVIYRTEPSASTAPLAEAAMLAGAHWHSTVLLIDQPLDAIVTPAQPLRFIRWSLFGITTLILGITMTSMIVAYLIISLRRTVQLEALTISLRATTASLHENNTEMTRTARHDALTGLPNRLQFRERLDQAIAAFGRGHPFVLLCLDLDCFKAVNDTLGHAAGDTLLCAVAGRIGTCLREVDIAARVGGDEFAIILSDTMDGAVVAQRLIECIGEPYTIDGQPVVIGVSIGGESATLGVNSETMVAAADLAMYEAKEAGRGSFRMFEARLRARVDAKRLIEHDLRGALERSELEVHYQPLVNLVEGRISCFEALVRWNHPQRGWIAPDEFIPVAEECGLIRRLGLWVLRTACEDAANWPQPVRVAVNVSPLQLTDPALLGKILDCLARSQLPAERLEIELTEAAVLEHSETTLALLTALRAEGVAVAFDDFGTGYSSLASLLHFPFDKIKIDRSFLLDVETSNSASAIVRAIVGLGTNLQLTTTGEGVETVEQLEHLRRLGCSEVQGYFFSEARPNADVPDLLRRLQFDGIASEFDPLVA